MATFILTDEFKRILEKQEIIDGLAQKGYDTNDFTNEILHRINKFDATLNLKSIAYHSLQDSDTYIGIILDEFLNKQYNVCVIPPKLGTRSGFLSQQIFGFISNLINGQQTSESYTLCDKPVIIINCMIDSLTNSAICNVIGAKIMGFKYIDIFNRTEDFGNSISTLTEFVDTVSRHKDISKDFSLSNNTLVINTQRLKNFTTSLTNEPYYFAINAYPAIILAKKEEIKIDSKDFEEKFAKGKSNKNIQAFVTFLKALKAVNFSNKSTDTANPLQLITYGAPGTGKSHEIKEKTAKKSVIRTTFHPDSDYSTFIGAYKPVMEEADIRVVPVVLNNGASFDQTNGTLKEKRISYKFVKQAFLKAYLGAWKKYAEAEGCADPQYLVIEEINRGNCAQIFGDLFQLLDRNDKKGFSTYPIDADTDLQKEIQNAFKEEKDGESDNPYKLSKDIDVESAVEDYVSNYGSSLSKDIQEGRVLLFPPNLYIWATMNTSDQSLFPMDSAFKRRWDWQYMPITNAKLRWKIELSEIYVKIDWWEFLKRINKVVADLTTSEDKQLGYFFCQPDSFIDSKNKSDNDKYDLITAKHFVDKVIFYLWNDVFKDYAFDASCCKDGNGKEVLFAQFYNEDGKSVNIDTLKHFFETLQSENEPSLVEEIPTKKQDKPEAE